MAETKKTAVVKPAAKAAAAKAAEAKKEEAKLEVVKEAPKAETKKPASKKTTKKASTKKESTKKASAEKAATKTRAKKAAGAEVVIQFAGNDYTTEKLVNIAKDVWQYDLNRKPEDFKTVKLYVKLEEKLVYYVINDDVSGSFLI